MINETKYRHKAFDQLFRSEGEKNDNNHLIFNYGIALLGGLAIILTKYF
jgi:hypothetical protein